MGKGKAKNSEPEFQPLMADRTIVLKPQTDNIVKCYCKTFPSPNSIFLASENEKLKSDKNFVVGRTLIQPSFSNGIYIRILNPTNSKITIHEHDMIARMEKIDSPKSVYTVKMGNRAKQSNSGETSIFHMEPFLNSMGSNSIKIDLSQSVLSETGKTELLNILNRNIKAFGEGGCYNGPITHRIDLIPGTPPIASRAYRAPIAVKEEMKKQINTMLEQGIIEPSTSAFSAPVVMVPKKDATLRFAIDFRRLNAATIKTVYHLPLIPEILDEVGGKHIFSTFDFAAGFHQIPMHERHKERTAFSCYLGLFQFLKMPMGLSGAPLTFQRVMNNLKQYISASFLIYLDDVILASEDEESHLKDINQFLEVV